MLTPIVVGVGDIKNRSTSPADAMEPLHLMLQAILQAIQDTDIPSNAAAAQLKSSIDSVSVVNTWTWPYPNLPRLISENLGIEPKFTRLSHHGGDSPAKLFDEAASRIARGKSKLAVVVGGEALASIAACAAAGQMPPPRWTQRDKSAETVSVSDISRLGENLGSRHSIGLPIHVYPLYENAFRAHRGQSIPENNQESSNLYAKFAKVAEQNPFAWNYGQTAATAETIGTVSKKNRMISFPYPLLMNAFNKVNLSAACLLTSTCHANSLGIPESKWIFPLGGAGTSDEHDFWQRPNYHSSPAISQSLDAALEVSHVRKEDICLWDFYSCFPIVPKLAAAHLSLPLSTPLTLLGGLTSFGGAGNNYSMHALTAMVRELRIRKIVTEPTSASARGLVLANGGMLTYQHVVILSSTAPEYAYPEANPLPIVLTKEARPEVTESASGEAVVETYTVEFHRSGSPAKGFVVGRLENGKRFIANHADTSTLTEFASGTRECVGRRGCVRIAADGRNVFSFVSGGKL